MGIGTTGPFSLNDLHDVLLGRFLRLCVFVHAGVDAGLRNGRGCPAEQKLETFLNFLSRGTYEHRLPAKLRVLPPERPSEAELWWRRDSKM